MENVDFFPSCEQIEIFKGFISVFPGDFDIQGAGRESEHTFHTHMHTLYFISDLLANSQGVTHNGRQRGSFRLLQPKDEEARSAIPAAEAITRTHYGSHSCLQTSTEESRVCTSLSFPSLLPPLTARGMIYTSLRSAPQWGVAAAY